MIEAEVHQQLRAFLRTQSVPCWPHHLTMARLVARALRLDRSALLQVGSASEFQGHYRLSYLMSVLMWPGPTLLVAPTALHQRLIQVDLPRLRDWLPSYKPIQVAEQWPDADFQGMLVTTPEAWLSDRLSEQNRFPVEVPLLIDGADDLETWIRNVLTSTLSSRDWENLILAYPDQQSFIRDSRVRLTHAAFQHPANPFHCHLLDSAERQTLAALYQELVDQYPSPEQAKLAMPRPWQAFWDQFHRPEHLLWASLNRESGQMTLQCCPAQVASQVEHLWESQPIVLMGAALDPDPKAESYRRRLGLADLTCLKFAPDRQNEVIQLYLPDHLPLPNTRQFQPHLYSEIQRLLQLTFQQKQGPTVILVGDLPLKAQLGATLAAEFGSRVQVERNHVSPEDGILVTGWQFWQTQKYHLPTPALLIVATLPIPSLENPLVAGQVAHYKRQRKDWFRLYLLPTALSELQRAIAPLRAAQGTVAMLDTRVHYRSYGRQILDALSPAACIRSLDSGCLFETETHAP